MLFPRPMFEARCIWSSGLEIVSERKQDENMNTPDLRSHPMCPGSAARDGGGEIPRTPANVKL